MFKFSTLIHALLALAILFVAVVFGFLDLSIGNLLGYIILAVVFTYVGIMVGRRSTRANEIADEIRERLELAEGKLREHGLSIPRRW